jgi:hypothetical protein
MKKLLLLFGALALAVSPAKADLITATAVVDGGAPQSTSSTNGTLNIVGVALGPFSFNTISINSQATLPPPGVLTTNSLDLQQSAAGAHSLVLDIVASQMTGSTFLQNYLSSFSVSGLTSGWQVREQTFLNGNQLADTGFFTTPSGSAFSTNLALETNPFSAAVRYTILSNGIGGFNGGIDIARTSPVPGPIVGAGLPGLMAGALFLLGLVKRRKQKLAA